MGGYSVDREGQGILYLIDEFGFSLSEATEFLKTYCFIEEERDGTGCDCNEEFDSYMEDISGDELLETIFPKERVRDESNIYVCPNCGVYQKLTDIKSEQKAQCVWCKEEDIGKENKV